MYRYCVEAKLKISKLAGLQDVFLIKSWAGTVTIMLTIEEVILPFNPPITAL